MMKIRKWVDMGSREVDVDVGLDDIAGALSEAFRDVTDDRFREEGPTRHDVERALNSIAAFFNALSDEHIQLLTPKAREIVLGYFTKQAERFKSAATVAP